MDEIGSDHKINSGKNMIHRFFIILILSQITLFCAPKEDFQEYRQNLDEAATLEDDQVVIKFDDVNDERVDEDEEEIEEAAMSATRRMSPEDAKATIDSQVLLEESEMMNGHISPQLMIRGLDPDPLLRTADYVEIIRCKKSFDIYTPMGTESLNDLYWNKSLTHIDREEKRFAWQLAKSNTRTCYIVQEFWTKPIYEDIASTDCNTMPGVPCWYYAVNPCISKARSITRKNECSYNISFTKPFYFENGLRGDVLEAASKVAKAEADVWILLEEVKALSLSLNTRITECENAVALEQAERAWKRGLMKLGATLVGAAVCSFIGPNAAQMCAMLAGSMIGMADEALGIGPIQNTCLTGEPRGPKGETKAELLTQFDERQKIIDEKIKCWNEQKGAGEEETPEEEDTPLKSGPGCVGKRKIDEVEKLNDMIKDLEEQKEAKEKEYKNKEAEYDEIPDNMFDESKVENDLEDLMDSLKDQIDVLEDQIEELKDLRDLDTEDRVELFEDEKEDIADEKEKFIDRIKVAEEFEEEYGVRKTKIKIEEILRKAQRDAEGNPTSGSGALEIAAEELQRKMDEAFNVTQDMVTKEQWMMKNEVDPDTIAKEIEANARQASD